MAYQGDVGNAESGVSAVGAAIYHINFTASMSGFTGSCAGQQSSRAGFAPLVPISEVGIAGVGGYLFHILFDSSMSSFTGSLGGVQAPSSVFSPLVMLPDVGNVQVGQPAVGARIYSIWFESAMAQWEPSLFSRIKGEIVNVYIVELVGAMNTFTGQVVSAKRKLWEFVNRFFKVRRENRTFVVFPDRRRK